MNFSKQKKIIYQIKTWYIEKYFLCELKFSLSNIIFIFFQLKLEKDEFESKLRSDFEKRLEFETNAWYEQA